MTTDIVKTRLRRATAVLALVCAGVAPAATLPTGDFAAVDLDPARSRVDFTLSSVLHTVHGTFQLKQGAIRFDPSSGTYTAIA